MNNLLAAFDMGVYDRFAVDGWEVINRQFWKAARWFDDLIVDTVAVDGTGASVRLFNLILRTIQSGKIQFYFLVIVFVLAGYAWKLTVN
jgi:NADH-quinone oxidoreductase subunit L